MVAVSVVLDELLLLSEPQPAPTKAAHTASAAAYGLIRCFTWVLL